MKRAKIKTIISGGQTGADRAAFDFALENDFEIEGFVPKNRRAEDGRISEKYPHLTETRTRSYRERTELNVRSADATLIVSHGPLTGGSLLTVRYAEKHRKPFLHLDFSETESAAAVRIVRGWLAAVDCRKLNVAGARASTDPKIYERTKIFLGELLAAEKEGRDACASSSDSP